MVGFKGFPPGKTRTTSIPNLFFSDLLPGIDHLAELKLTLYCFWVLQQQEGEARYLSRREILQDKLFLSGLAEDPNVAAERLVGCAGTRHITRDAAARDHPRRRGTGRPVFYEYNTRA